MIRSILLRLVMPLLLGSIVVAYFIVPHVDQMLAEWVEVKGQPWRELGPMLTPYATTLVDARGARIVLPHAHCRIQSSARAHGRDSDGAAPERQTGLSVGERDGAR